MRSLLILILALTLFAGCQDKSLQTATITAKTIVCESCAKTIKKAVYAVEGVKAVDVDIKAKIVTVKFLPAQTDLKTLEAAISDAGYDANDRKRDQAAYEKLDACCKIDG